MRSDFDPRQLGPREFYKFLTSVVVPRPIAWVSSTSLAGVDNLAPHSFFTVASVDPPIIQFTSVGDKDSLRNIEATGEFVVNLVSEADSAAMNFTCIDGPPEFDELAAAGIPTLPSSVIGAPRIATAPVAMECRLYEAVETEKTTIALGEVLRFHIDDAFIDAEKLHVDTLAMNLVARVHGAGWYARTTDLFQMTRPTFAQWNAEKAES